MDRETLLTYARNQFAAEPEYLWAGHPTYCVLRRGGSRKWFAALMDVPRARLGLDGPGSVDLLNVRCGPLLSGSLLGREGFLPAYHMNKTNWVSIRLDGSAPEGEILELLAISYHQTGPKGSKRPL